MMSRFFQMSVSHILGGLANRCARRHSFKDIDYNSKTILEMKVMRPYSILCLKVRSTDIHSMAENPEDAQQSHRRFTQFTI